MKKYWYIAIAVLVVLLVVGGVYLNYQSNHPDSSFERMPRALREEMLANWPADRFGKRFLDGNTTRYYGTHGDCVAFFFGGSMHLSMHWEFHVAGSDFWYPHSFTIMVYHDGEFVEIDEAYQRGWLNRWQIKSIAQYHRQMVIEKFGEEVYE